MLKHLTRDFFRNKRSLAISWPFLAVGVLFGTWATFIPQVKVRFSLNDADLGLLLLSLPVGTLSMNAVGAFLVNRIGMQRSTLFGLFFMSLAFIVPLNIFNIWLMPIALFFCGAGISITNVSMNTVVGSMELNEKINIMSTCHGLFSIGLMVASIGASFSIGEGLFSGYYFAGVGIIMILGGLVVARTILAIADVEESTSDNSPKKFSFPKGALLLMIIIGLCSNFVEGTMADWSSVYMREIVKANVYYTGWGLAAYSLFMAMGRFFGDALIPKFGANKILSGGAIIAFVGLVLIILFPFLVPAIVGFGLVGAGVSCSAPILYASSSRVPGMRKGAGLAIMNTFAMTSFMLGPVLIGFVSEAWGLVLAFTIITVLAIVWGVLSFRAKLF